jgi:ribonuclease P protein component
MLPKKYRVKNFRDFKQLLNDGSYFGVKEFYIKCLPNNLPYSKVSVVVPVKIDKRAVVRNRIKRQLSEIIRLIYKEIKPGFNVALFCKEPILTLEYNEMKKQVEFILKRTDLLK